MSKEQVSESKEVSEVVQKRSTGGSFSDNLMEKPLMQRKAVEHEAIFGNAPVQMSIKEKVAQMGIDVKYNSSEPAKVGAHAFAQGNTIHLASGQEKHLPHEIGHVMQQREGKVKATTSVNGIKVNDDPKLEREANVIGAKALQMKSSETSKVNTTTLQLNKKDHHQGDLYYGISDPRYDLADKKGAVRRKEDPVSIDNINAETQLTDIFTGGGDYFAGYFNLMNLLKSKTYNIRLAWSQAGKEWIQFLQRRQNLDYLSVEKHYRNVKDRDPNIQQDPTKDRITKNGRGGDLPVGKDVDELQRAIVRAYENGTVNAAIAGGGKNYKDEANRWIFDVFFRRTSKLGIKFTVERNKVIHMNVYAPPHGGKPATTLDKSANEMMKNGGGRQPITFSELRYIYKEYGENHANIDLAYYKPNVGGNVQDAPQGEAKYFQEKIKLGKKSYRKIIDKVGEGQFFDYYTSALNLGLASALNRLAREDYNIFDLVVSSLYIRGELSRMPWEAVIFGHAEYYYNHDFEEIFTKTGFDVPKSKKIKKLEGKTFIHDSYDDSLYLVVPMKTLAENTPQWAKFGEIYVYKPRMKIYNARTLQVDKDYHVLSSGNIFKVGVGLLDSRTFQKINLVRLDDKLEIGVFNKISIADLKADWRNLPNRVKANYKNKIIQDYRISVLGLKYGYIFNGEMSCTIEANSAKGSKHYVFYYEDQVKKEIEQYDFSKGGKTYYETLKNLQSARVSFEVGRGKYMYTFSLEDVLKNGGSFRKNVTHNSKDQTYKFTLKLRLA